MNFALKPPALEIRYLFKGYAVLMVLTGIAVTIWGDAWLGPHLACDAHTRVIVSRIFGALLVAAGFASASVGAADDPEIQRRAAGWFAAGHFAVYLSLFNLMVFDRIVDMADILTGWQGTIMMAAAVVFTLFWQYRDGEPVPRPIVQSLFSGEGTRRLRSRYEEQLRLAASQEERHRLARDLHDSVKQQLFVIQTSAATAQTRFDGDSAGAREAITQVRNAAREAIVEMQAMLDQLRAAPLENTGLVEALKKQCEALGFRTGAKVNLELGSLPPSESVRPGTQQGLLRATQEALSNIARHARAKNVWVSLNAASGQWELRIKDDGSGFDTDDTGGMGISNMRARAEEFGGMFEIHSLPGHGTTVRVALPYEEVEPGSARHFGIMALLSLLGIVSILVLIIVWKVSTSFGLMLGMGAVACARNIAGYLRARRRKEVQK